MSSWEKSSRSSSGASDSGAMSRALRFLQGVEERIGAQLAECLEKLVGEGSSHHGGGSQRPAPVVSEAFQATSEDESQAFRDVEFADDHLGAEAPVLVVEASFLGQVLEDLLGEERVALGLGVHGGDQQRWRRLSAQGAEQCGHAVLGEAPQAQLVSQAAAQQALERAGETVIGGHLRVAVVPTARTAMWGMCSATCSSSRSVPRRPSAGRRGRRTAADRRPRGRGSHAGC